jgi:hypothetical protein
MVAACVPAKIDEYVNRLKEGVTGAGGHLAFRVS